MTADEYQQKASRTINHHLNREQMIRHALFCMCSEIGELQGIYQKQLQGHEWSEEHANGLE